MKKPVFIVAEDPHVMETEADVLAKLDQDEEFLLRKHPRIDDDTWRLIVSSFPGHGKDQLAIETLDRLRLVREGLQDPTTPAWRVAAVAMSFQDRLKDYWQQVIPTALGRVYADRKAPRQVNDELCVRVLCHLRGRLRGKDKTWKKTLQALEVAASNESKIADVEIEQDGNKFIFTLEHDDNSATVEDFKVSTLECKKFNKAR